MTTEYTDAHNVREVDWKKQEAITRKERDSARRDYYDQRRRAENAERDAQTSRSAYDAAEYNLTMSERANKELNNELLEQRADYEAMRARYISALDALKTMVDLFGSGRVVIDSGEAKRAVAAANQSISDYLEFDAPTVMRPGEVVFVPVGPKPGDVMFECTADAAAGEIFDFVDEHPGIPMRFEFVGGTVSGVILSAGIRYVRIQSSERSPISPDTQTVKIIPWRGLRRATLL